MLLRCIFCLSSSSNVSHIISTGYQSYYNNQVIIESNLNGLPVDRSLFSRSLHSVLSPVFVNLNKLFQLFVYPYIKQDTLLQLTDILLVSRVSLFLYQCCREIEDILVKDTKDKHVMELVPGRQSVLWNENKTNSTRAVPVMSLEKFAANSLFLSMPQRVPTFIFDLISNAKAGSPDFHILSKDEKYMQTLKKTKIEFISKYEMVVKEQRATTSFP